MPIKALQTCGAQCSVVQGSDSLQGLNPNIRICAAGRSCSQKHLEQCNSTRNHEQARMPGGCKVSQSDRAFPWAERSHLKWMRGCADPQSSKPYTHRSRGPRTASRKRQRCRRGRSRRPGTPSNTSWRCQPCRSWLTSADAKECRFRTRLGTVDMGSELWCTAPSRALP